MIEECIVLVVQVRFELVNAAHVAAGRLHEVSHLVDNGFESRLM